MVVRVGTCACACIAGLLEYAQLSEPAPADVAPRRTLVPFDLAARARAGDPRRVGAVLMVTAMLLFAAMALATRVASRQMGAAQLTVIRFAVCGAGVLVFSALGGGRLAPQSWRLLVLRGLFGGVAVLLYFVAIARCRDTGTAVLLNLVSPIYTSLFAWAFLRERPGGRLGLGIVLAFTGVLLVLRTPDGFHLGPGELAGIASAILSGLAVTTIRAARATDGAAAILFVFCVTGFLISLPLAVADWRAADAVTWAYALGMGALSLVAQLLMTHAFGLVTAPEGALYQQLTPAFTFVLGALFLHEAVSVTAIGGTALIVGAVVWASRATPRPVAGPKPSA